MENIVPSFVTPGGMTMPPGADYGTYRQRRCRRAVANPADLLTSHHNAPLTIILPRLPVENRNRRRGAAKLQLQHREPMECRVWNDDILARQQLADLGEAQPVPQPPLDRHSLRDAPVPAIAAGPPPGRMERQQDVAQLLVGYGPRARLHAHGPSRRVIPQH